MKKSLFLLLLVVLVSQICPVYAVTELPSAGVTITPNNRSFTLTGEWIYWSTGGFGGMGFYFSLPGTGEDIATWPLNLELRTTLPGPGFYEVYLFYPSYGVLAINAPFTINHNGVSDTVIVDQTTNGNEWFGLGVYYFDGLVSSKESVTLTDNADSYVIADAIAVTLPDGIVDNSYIYQFSVLSGEWGTASAGVAPGVYGPDLRYSAAGDGSSKVFWKAELAFGAGLYEVSVCYPVSSLLATNAPYTVNHNGIEDTILVDQSVTRWKGAILGGYDFTLSDGEGITLSNDADSWVIADLVKFEFFGIVDNPSPEFSTVGSWGVAPSDDGKVKYYYGRTFWFSASGTGEDKAIWSAKLSEGAGLYEVKVWYPERNSPPAFAFNAPYTINHNGVSDTVIVDQNSNGGRWFSLGTYDFADDGTENVTLTDESLGWAIADAVVFLPVVE